VDVGSFSSLEFYVMFGLDKMFNCHNIRETTEIATYIHNFLANSSRVLNKRYDGELCPKL
jgi:hypothetical protein